MASLTPNPASAPHRPSGPLRGVETTRMGRHGNGPRDPRQPVHATDLLDDIDLGGRIGPPRRDGDRQVVAHGVRRETDRVDEVHHRRPVERQPQDGVDRAGRTATVARSGRFPSATTEPGRSVAASCCTNSSASRSSARSAMSGSMPRLKRAEASECRLCRAEVSATDCGSHQAASTMTSVVVSEISVDAPPITPARAIGTSSPSTMTPSAGSRARSTPSSVSSCSPALTRRTRSCAPRTLSRSKAWVGWPSSSIT